MTVIDTSYAKLHVTGDPVDLWREHRLGARGMVTGHARN